MRWDELNDPVLRRLLRMGIFDWRNDGTRLHQATQAIRHGTAIGTRILGRVLEVERKVPVQHCFAFCAKLIERDIAGRLGEDVSGS